MLEQRRNGELPKIIPVELVLSPVAFISRGRHASQWNTDRFTNSCTDMPPQCGSPRISIRSARLPARPWAINSGAQASSGAFKGFFADLLPQSRLIVCAQPVILWISSSIGAAPASPVACVPLPIFILYALVGTIKKPQRNLPFSWHDGGMRVARSCSARARRLGHKKQGFACRRSATAGVRIGTFGGCSSPRTQTRHSLAVLIYDARQTTDNACSLDILHLQAAPIPSCNRLAAALLF
jgi:hypothetical protein